MLGAFKYEQGNQCDCSSVSRVDEAGGGRGEGESQENRSCRCLIDHCSDLDCFSE